MQSYFTEKEFFEICKQRKKHLIIYITTLIAFLGVSFFVFYIFTKQPYGSNMLKIIKIVQYVLTSIYVFFSFLYLGIIYNRVNRFYKHCKRLVIGKKEISELDFFEFDSKMYVKDGVECKTIIFLEWNEFRQIYFERKVLVFYEREFPQIPERAFVRIETQGNFLISYEILENRDYAEGEEPRPPEYVLR